MIPTPEQLQSAIGKAEQADAAVASIVRTDFNRFSVWRGASDVRKRWVVGVLAFTAGVYSGHRLTVLAVRYGITQVSRTAAATTEPSPTTERQ